ncbi:MAG: GIY-YIG nuclease family protein [Caldisericaceae bacterium]|nr:GIY-YIG nuclease family protein [Caldisericaceae bacterium]
MKRNKRNDKKQYYVYILTNRHNSVLYIGITNNLTRRLWEHKNKFVESFANKYNVNKLVCYEVFSDFYNAISREKQLKNWHRDWKVSLINQFNPDWKDLSKDL